MERINNTSWFSDFNKTIKVCDKTVFKEHSTITPKDSIREFFHHKELNPGQSIYIEIIFQNKIELIELKRELEFSDKKSFRTKLSWKNTSISSYLESIDLNKYKLIDRFKSNVDLNNYVLMKFEKKNIIIREGYNIKRDTMIELIIEH